MESRLVAIVVLGILYPSVSGSQDVDERPVFEVASVRPSDGEGRLSFPRSTPDRLTANAPLTVLISSAYEVLPDRIEGAAGWMTSDAFTISARAPDGTPSRAIPLMLRALLEDRFKLVARWEARERDVHALTLAPGGRLGPFLTRPEQDVDCESVDAERAAAREAVSDTDARQQLTFEQYFSDGPVCDGASGTRVLPGGGHETFLVVSNSPLESLAMFLSVGRDRPVVDHTGLTGTFDYRLRYVPQPPLSTSQPGDTSLQPRTEGPDLIEALEQQLGLRLEATRAPVPVLVIESAERPKPN